MRETLSCSTSINCAAHFYPSKTCQSFSHHYDKTPDTNNLKDERFILVHDCRGFFQSMATWICWFGAMVRQPQQRAYVGGGSRNKKCPSKSCLTLNSSPTIKISHCFTIMLSMDSEASLSNHFSKTCQLVTKLLTQKPLGDI